MANDTPRNADFIGKVVSDAANPPETRMLSGWLGDAGEKALRRLYTDPDLSSYIDIPAEAILHTEEIKDLQPAGAVLVWIRKDAAVKQGGSASSRAARFLQGQVQQDFASGGAGSFEQAGLRCVTQIPCAEPTGFSGLCTKQPDVGGCWPCITAIPHCVEPTGFTGKCTHQPWPNPTRYAGCTIFHCPTQDLTHNPHICNLVATGMPGCIPLEPGPVIDPGKQAKDKAGAPVPTPPVSVNCGHTQLWGLCGGGATQDLNCVQTVAPGCGFSRNPVCTDLPGCGVTKPPLLCQQTQPPKCLVSVQIPCIPQTEVQGCGIDPGLLGAAAGRQAVPAGTLILQCNPSVIDACPSRIQQFCPTPNTQCTQNGPECQTHQAPQCPTHQPCCTQDGPHCRTIPAPRCQPTIPQNIDCTFGCTQFGPNCPVTLINATCTINDPNVAVGAAAQQQAIGTFIGCAPTPATRCFICPPSQFGGCQTQPPVCFVQAQPAQQQAIAPTAFNCEPTPATVCFICPPSRFGDCGTQPPYCVDQLQAGGAAQQQQAIAPTVFNCEPTPATVCFICPPSRFGDCGTQPPYCVDQLQGAGAAQQQNIAIAPTPATRCFICPPSHFGICHTPLPFCAPTPNTRCFICPPSPFVACGHTVQPIVCGGGGGGPSAVDACPSAFCPPGGGFDPAAAGGAGNFVGAATGRPGLCLIPSQIQACPSQNKLCPPSRQHPFLCPPFAQTPAGACNPMPFVTAVCPTTVPAACVPFTRPGFNC